jgi:ABC-2 type transport system permease protein
MSAVTGMEAMASGQSVAAATIVDTIRSEWIKLRTTRTTMVLLLCALGLELLVVGLTAIFVSVDPFDTENLVGAVTITTIPVGLMIGVIGSLIITSEFVHGTIRPTFAATPRDAGVCSPPSSS